MAALLEVIPEVVEETPTMISSLEKTFAAGATMFGGGEAMQGATKGIKNLAESYRAYKGEPAIEINEDHPYAPPVGKQGIINAEPTPAYTREPAQPVVSSNVRSGQIAYPPAAPSNPLVAAAGRNNGTSVLANTAIQTMFPY